jgi:enamine deaminase RidA (YjgF/YER057c/UK114 family)
VFIRQIEPGDAARTANATGQIEAVLAELEIALAARELCLDDLLRLRLFVTDSGDTLAIERALDSFGPAQWPAVSVVELPTGSTPGVTVTLDAVATSGARKHRRVMRLSEGGDREARAGSGSQPRSVRCGPWVFVGATTAMAARAPSFPPSDHPDFADSMTRRIGEESRAVFARIEALLREQDAELRDVVSVGGWLTFPMRGYGPLGDVRDALIAEGLFPASAAVQVGRVWPDPALLAFEAIAFAPEDPRERERWRAAALPPPSPLAPYYASARSAGGYVFTCGEVPTRTAKPNHAAERDRPAAVKAQAGEVYERLGANLAEHGTGRASAVHQTVFVRRLRDRDAVADAARAFFGADAMPPTTLLSVADLGFHPGCDVEIALIAAGDGRATDAR